MRFPPCDTGLINYGPEKLRGEHLLGIMWVAWKCTTTNYHLYEHWQNRGHPATPDLSFPKPVSLDASAFHITNTDPGRTGKLCGGSGNRTKAAIPPEKQNPSDNAGG
jgi:hypothetical protein